MFKQAGILKEFGPEGYKVIEEVAARPSLGRFAPLPNNPLKFFCLRIDADEYSPESFSRYMPVFKKYQKAITIFFNINSFKNAKEEITGCRDAGCEIQSHAYYHYTYSDYRSNRYNINKAKKFLLEMGIDTRGFVSPSGRWNPGLMKAMEDEGYVYASEFSYDYMGYPNYPYLGKRYSRILEIPVFPVAPELFFRKENIDIGLIKKYYFDVIDVLISHDIPVIIYAHTDPGMLLVPDLLDSICDYALNKRSLYPVQMGQVYDMYREKTGPGDKQQETVNLKGIPGEEFTGRPVSDSFCNNIKRTVKKILDYETITPERELKCKKARKMLKLLARKVAGSGFRK
jgi:peptidoglycan/xylan/chitin deacetylase (PgdA/CDA1 family)